ncbi:MAG: chemotaxis protein CheY [Stenotrophomonas rhizophila]|jgi:twitching motility two-component system response regulator PilH|uniref:Twitching motility two-component system response regulator PilH n=1 Tax=Stenotrophomonas rhizophila TaxID=216778 RepID=A0AAP5AHQ6_9GAMM|nr:MULTISPECIES: response regulator [Stenotrophomonas]HBZ47717.1 response regulator [Stenotrophomonas sp.]AOA73274.1 chemotaxis protein CheY [Stenotrophomonas rhizophila]MDF2817898.1 chemotaxis protein CheY [Stenotrophomonas rhizophila]MDQ1061775.1 twitching motility two-component system response regulator PilH [Stenotrophomonas sp. SORGH_AS_0282]MDQ1107758.1 twitching motility two-component system response regulator PilH [Stenotrophomonas rhizophila]
MARIVLIEDSPTDRAVFIQWLTKAGHEVLEAGNAEDGIKLVQEHQPQLVLMDVVLPGMSGFQATRALNRDEKTKAIPVIIVSTKAMETDKAWGLRQGAAAYVVKPPREEDLIAQINELLVS